MAPCILQNIPTSPNPPIPYPAISKQAFFAANTHLGQQHEQAVHNPEQCGVAAWLQQLEAQEREAGRLQQLDQAVNLCARAANRGCWLLHRLVATQKGMEH